MNHMDVVTLAWSFIIKTVQYIKCKACNVETFYLINIQLNVSEFGMGSDCRFNKISLFVVEILSNGG